MRENKGGISGEDVDNVLRSMTNSEQSSNSLADFVVRKEIEKMANYIVEAKQEMSELKPGADGAESLGDATSQLDAVVAQTEEATNTILDAVDEISDAVNASGDQELITKINVLTAQIFEASNFQDLTGQRIQKVLATLAYVEGKIARIMELFGGAEPREGKASGSSDDGKVQGIISGRKEEEEAGLLNGPQMDGDAPTQEDIDKLFDSL
jgi:chemotaxis protein CheZ